MDYLEILDPPQFNTEITKVDKEAFITAEIENEIKRRLLNNDIFLKSVIDEIAKKVINHIDDKIIHVTDKQKEEWSAKAENTEVSREKKGLMSPTDKTKLDGIAGNAEVNQNAFSNVKVGNTTVAANGKTAAVELVAETNIKLTADNATKKITINGPSVVTTTANGLMTKEDKIKLNNIANNANNYTHPNAHPATMITQDSTHRFVTDNEKSTWNGKANTTPATPTANGLMTKEDKAKLNNIANKANNYTHPTSSGNKHIPSGGSSGQILRWSADGTGVWGEDNNTTYPYYNKAIDNNFTTQFRTQTKGNTAQGNYISNVRAEASNVHFLPIYGSGLAWGSIDTHGYLGVSYNGADAYIGGGNADKLNWVKRILLEGDSTPANGGNADTLGEKHDVDFVQYKGQLLSDEEINNPNFPFAYESIIADGTKIGLPDGFWHIKNFRHPHGNGFNTQLALPLNHDNVMRYRRATSMSWGDWVVLATKNQLDDCFQLVSNGKTLVANAITDKGVSTAANAEFATLANNIRNIQTGVNTSDATMTASNLLSGKTGYVNGKKITGSMTNWGAVSATLNSGDIYRIPAGYHNGQGEIRARSLIKNTQTQSFIHVNPMIQEGLYFSISKDGFIKVNISAKVTNGGNVTREIVFYNGKELESKGHFIPASFSNSQLTISFGTAYDEGEAMVTIYDLSSIL